MKLFLVFLLASFLGGTVFWSEKVSRKIVVLLGLGLILIVGYFFFYQL